jgi:uncharacterized protein YbaR (Trm112 family)
VPEDTRITKEANVVSQELLEILRCPSCVRDDRPDPGMLDRQGNWLICVDCDRKYPIRDDIPVMLIEEGDRFRAIAADDLPAEPPPEVRAPAPLVPAARPEDRQQAVLAVVGVAIGIAVVLTAVMWLLHRRQDE